VRKRAKFRSGIVGAGYVSEYHVAALRRIDSTELAGVFDLDSSKAERLAARAGIKVYPSLEAMCGAGINVIHVLTPPDTHVRVALKAIELGCDVLIEKPLATDIADCAVLRAAAQSHNRQVCVNHSLLFDPQIQAAFDLIRRGKLGRVLSVDILRSSVYPPYSGGPLPPHYRTAGYPFRDLGIHALYLMQAFLGAIEDIKAEWRSLGGDPNLAFDEWRTLVRCQNGMGQFQLSWNIKPLQSQVIIQGTKGVLRADLFLMSHTLRSPFPVKAPERVLNALTDSIPMAIDAPVNVIKFLTKKVLPYHGLQDFVRAFYTALESGAPMPVSVEDATALVHWTELVAREAELDHEHRLARGIAGRDVLDRSEGPILVTGASGSIGGAVAKALLKQGHRVRLFVRRLPDEALDGAEFIVGNLGDPEMVRRAVCGAAAVVHAGAAMKGTWADHQCATITGTENILEACREAQVAKLVYISSMSVLDLAGGDQKAPLDEMSPLEPRAQERGFYTQAKLEAECLVTDYVKRFKIPAVILRPAWIFGPGSSLPLLSAVKGCKLANRWFLLGDGKGRLPLVHIEDVVEAILSVMKSSLHDGEVIQIVSPIQPSQDELLRIVEGSDVKIAHLPRSFVLFIGKLSEILLKPLRRKSPFSAYRLESALAKHEFRSVNAEALLDWQPRIGVFNVIDSTVDTRSTRAS
jgi:predicted dehydrogenase/nucleoside-diphosphate-sugar epimerase